MPCPKISVLLAIFITFFISIGNCNKLPKCCPVDGQEFKNGTCKYFKIQSNEIFLSSILDKVFKESRPECFNELVLVEERYSSVGAKVDESFTRNGYFRFGDIYYPPAEYCVNRIVSDGTDGDSFISISAWICEPNCSESNPCFAKCCPPDEVVEYKLVTDEKVCSPSGSQYWSPLLENENNSSRNASKIFNPRFIVNGRLMNSDEQSFHFSQMKMPGFDQLRLRILQNGSVRVGPSLTRFDSNFCLDGVFISDETNGTIEDVPEFSGNSEDTVLLREIPLRKKPQDPMTVNIYKGAFLIAAIFLVFNITVYVCLWGTRKSVYWLTQLSYFVSLFFMYVFLAGAFILPMFVRHQPDKVIASPLCYVVGVLAHFFFLSTFCWMTMINVNIWSTFGFPDKMIANSRSRSSNRKRFKKYIWYAIFATTIPVIIVGTAVVLDNHPGAREQDFITPDYARQKCYLKADALFAYLYGPIGVLLAVNVIIYITTVVSVIRFKNKGDKMSVALKKSSKGSQSPVSESRQSLKLFAKLFLIMGVPWVFELIGWAYGSDFWIWKTFDILNILQSVMIFFIFICKNGIFRELRAKYACFDKLLTSLHIRLGTLETLGTSSATHTTSTSGTGSRKRSADVNAIHPSS